MDSRQIILSNIVGEGPRPGLTFTNGRLNDMVHGSAGAPVGYSQRRWVEGEFEYYDDIWGNIWHRAKDGCVGGEVLTPAIGDWEQLKTFTLPAYDFNVVADSFRTAFAEANGRFKMAGMPGWIFAAARYLRKMEVYLMDMLLYPDELKCLHEKLALFYESFIRAAGKAGADGIVFAEDMGTQQGLLFSPTLWQEYFGELYARLFGTAHELGIKVFMHSCGKNSEIIEPLLQAGVDCFQFDQPTVYDMAKLAALLKKHRAAIWSPIDIQKILPTGDLGIIEAGVEDMFRHFNGSLIFKNYGDLPGIGVKPEWDQWAYDAILRRIPSPQSTEFQR